MLKKAISIFKINYKYIYSGILMIFVFFLPHSRFVLSLSEIALVFIWISEGNFKLKFETLKTQPEILIFASVFLIHFIGLFYTQNFSYALKDLRIKLPILFFPVILATSLKFSSEEIRKILIIFTVSLIIKSLYGISLLYGFFGDAITNPQLLAGKYSHIRYALMLNIAVFSMVYYLLFYQEKQRMKFKLFYVVSFIWLSFFILILHSVTGWVIYFILLIFSVIWLSFVQKKRLFKCIFILLTLFIILGTGLYLLHSFRKFNKSDEIDQNKTANYTKSGNRYKNNFKSNQKENGHFVNLYFCEKELKKEWNKAGTIDYDGKDKKGQNVKYTLIRYLTSKNFKKDKEGFLQLNKQDIKNIENGMTNYIFAEKFSLYPKIYEILWQADHYFSGANPDNQSISQRFEFLKNGKNIIKQHFWFGVGTGDIKDEFQKQYKFSDTQLSVKHRLRAHNQYVTFFITFGFVGFLWFLFTLIYPPIKTKKYKSYLFLISFIIIGLSMLNEDTLETQMGATIFAFFLSFFLFAEKE